MGKPRSLPPWWWEIWDHSGRPPHESYQARRWGIATLGHTQVLVGQIDIADCFIATLINKIRMEPFVYPTVQCGFFSLSPDEVLEMLEFDELPSSEFQVARPLRPGWGEEVIQRWERHKASR